MHQRLFHDFLPRQIGVDHVELAAFHTSDAAVAREVRVGRDNDIPLLDLSQWDFNELGVAEIVDEFLSRRAPVVVRRVVEDQAELIADQDDKTTTVNSGSLTATLVPEANVKVTARQTNDITARPDS